MGRINCASKCLIKRSFDDEKTALEEMKWLKVDKKYKKLKRAYQCKLCNKWHLTKREHFNNIYVKGRRNEY